MQNLKLPPRPTNSKSAFQWNLQMILTHISLRSAVAKNVRRGAGVCSGHTWDGKSSMGVARQCWVPAELRDVGWCMVTPVYLVLFCDLPACLQKQNEKDRTDSSLEVSPAGEAERQGWKWLKWSAEEESEAGSSLISQQQMDGQGFNGLQSRWNENKLGGELKKREVVAVEPVTIASEVFVEVMLIQPPVRAISFF